MAQPVRKLPETIEERSQLTITNHEAPVAARLDQVAWATQAIVEAPTNTFLCDMDMNIVFANQKSFETLDMMEPNLHNWSESWKTFHAEEIVGSTLDFLFTDAPDEYRMAKDPRNHPYFGTIRTGPCTCEVRITGVYDVDGNATGYTVYWERITDKIAQEERIVQLLSALDGAQTNIMITDEDLRLIYMNEHSAVTLRRLEPDLKAMYGTQFDPKNLLGTCFDEFHPNPDHQPNLLKKESIFPYSTNINVGQATLSLTISQVKNKANRIIAYSAEWTDITSKLAEELGAAVETKETLDLMAMIEQKATIANEVNVEMAARIEKLKAVTLAISKGDVRSRVEIEKDDLVGQLGGAFNKMADSLTPMANIANQIASGDLTATVKPYNDKDVLGNAFAGMVTNLSGLVAQTFCSSEAIASECIRISEGADDLLKRTEKQAASLEETAASMEEMTATVRRNANNADRADHLAADAQVVVEKGGQLVAKAVNSMDEINCASKRIADIISVIDEISGQINALALAAAVEAARVGKKGRGFAVVAGEVRCLAGRSATAAKEIKSLVQDIVVKAGEGSQLIHDSGTQLDVIVHSVKKVADIIADISNASQEQATGIEQVNMAIMQMDQITQQNAELVDDAAAASQSMSAQAFALQALVEKFTVKAEYINIAREGQKVFDRGSTVGAKTRRSLRPLSSSISSGRAETSASSNITSELKEF